MNARMARNLVGAGHSVTFWNRSGKKAHALARDIGCAVVDSPAALTAAAEFVVTMLADDPS